MNKRVLIYNWTQFDDRKGRGGGVSVYLRNIIPVYIAEGWDVYFLSSGCHYSLLKRGVFYKPCANLFEDIGVKSFRIFNSPIKAPHHDSFGQISNSRENSLISEVFLDFVQHHGEFDEIHFHNIEGISALTVEQVSKQTKAKIITWFHNYHWVCPQIELFKNGESKCRDYSNGADCVTCLDKVVDVQTKIRSQRIASFIELSPLIPTLIKNPLFSASLISIRFLRTLTSRARQLGRKKPEKAPSLHKPSNSLASEYKKWREANLALINEHVDICIAVSKLAAETMKSFEVNPAKVKEVPLGMDVYNVSFRMRGLTKARAETGEGKLRVGYLGNPNKSKGLQFLLDSMASMPGDLQQKLKLKVYSRVDAGLLASIEMLAEKLEVDLQTGYQRDELGAIAQEIDVVIVPSIWWETFNQVAYEMTMKGVPVLISDSVGIANYLPQNFVFGSGSQSSLTDLILRIESNRELLEEYWNHNDFGLVSLSKHFDQLQLSLRDN